MEIRQYNIKAVAKSLDPEVSANASSEDIIVRVNVRAGQNPLITVATINKAGLVKPDGETITVDDQGTLSSTVGLKNGTGESSIQSSSTKNYDGTPYDTDEKKIEATGHESLAFGRGCKATGTRSYAQGSYCKSEGNASVAIGQKNEATENANRGFVGGYDNKIDNNITFAFGQGLINSRERKATFGQWNYDEYDTLLEVGCGTSDEDRRNAFEVRTNGLVIANDRLKVYGKPEDDTDVVRLEELDKKADKVYVRDEVLVSNVDGSIKTVGYYSSAKALTLMWRDAAGRTKVENGVSGSDAVNFRQLDTKYDKVNKIIFEERTDSEQTTRIMNGRVRSYSAPSAVDSYWAGIEPMGLTIHYVKSEEQSEDGGAIYHWHLKYPEENEWSGDTDILNTPPKTSGTLATLTDVSNEIAKVVGGADTSYDTLKEIADWIKAHPNDASELASRISSLESGKLDKNTSSGSYRCYSILADGTQSFINYATAAYGGHLVLRKTGGYVTVPENPRVDTDAASKKYVDDIVGNIETALDSIIAIQNSILGGNA